MLGFHHRRRVETVRRERVVELLQRLGHCR
jgi:hypothetical protein